MSDFKAKMYRIRFPLHLFKGARESGEEGKRKGRESGAAGEARAETVGATKSV